MTEREWTNATSEFRERVFKSIPDALGIAPDAPWDALPYWLRRHIAHFVCSEREHDPDARRI
jgi:hypothetical protein